MVQGMLIVFKLMSLLLLLVACSETGTLPRQQPQSGKGENMLTVSQFKTKYQNSEQVALAIIGDSTTSGFGANPSPNLWTNGLAYGCVNNPRFGENWKAYLADGVTPNPYYINTTGFPSQAQQDNTGIPSAVRLLRTAVESRNGGSEVYNYGGSGWTAGNHVSEGTVATVAALVPKPDVIFFNLGINSAKSNASQDTDLRTLVSQAIANDILPILVKPNNIGVADSPSGSWGATACPDNWYPMDNWPSIRNNIQQIADDNGLSVIDLGTEDGILDETLLYDSFHPSNLGYEAIYRIYDNFLGSPVIVGSHLVKIRNGRYYDNVVNGNSAFKMKTSTGRIIGVPLNYYRLRLSSG